MQDKSSPSDSLEPTSNRSDQNLRESSSALFDRALFLLQQNRFSESNDICEFLIKDHPENFHVLQLSGVLAFQLNDPSRAVRQLESAIKVNSRQSDAHNSLGVVYRALSEPTRALNCFDKALALEPEFVEAHHNRGLVLHDLRRFNEAIESFEKAITLYPAFADAHQDMSLTLKELKRLDESLVAINQSLEIRPNHPETLNNKGVLLLEWGKVSEAVECFNQAIAINPDFAQAFFNRGNARQMLNKLEAACSDYDRSASLNPGLVGAYLNLGLALAKLNRPDEALKSYGKALEMDQSFPQAHTNLGNLLKDLGRLNEAILHHSQAITIKSDFYEAFNNRGMVLYEAKRFEEALKDFDKAILLNPNYCEAHFNRGNTLMELMRPDEGIQSFDCAILSDQRNPIFRVKKINATLPIVPQNSEIANEAHTNFKRAMKEFEAWFEHNPSRQIRLSDFAAISTPFYLAYRQGNHCQTLSEYGNLLVKSLVNSNPRNIFNIPKRSKIRLLIISAHVRRHSVWDVVLKGIINNINLNQFDLALYHTTRNLTDKETIWARNHVQIWRDATEINQIEGWIDAIQIDQPDIILYPELGMDPVCVALATQRLAPLQLASWGHPITTGLPTIDAFISGELLEGPNPQEHYREKIYTLPDTGCCIEPYDTEKAPLPDSLLMTIRRCGPLFLIPHKVYKLDPVYDLVFVEIAKHFEACTFLFAEWTGDVALVQGFISRLNYTFISNGLDPDLYIKTFKSLRQAEFFSLLESSDVFLDCPGFSGYTTAWQAVHQGLPVVTLEGEFLRQRLAAGILRQIGHTDTIANNTDDYIEIAVRLGRESLDKKSYSLRKEQLRTDSTKLYHRVDIIRSLEALLKRLSART